MKLAQSRTKAYRMNKLISSRKVFSFFEETVAWQSPCHIKPSKNQFITKKIKLQKLSDNLGRLRPSKQYI